MQYSLRRSRSGDEKRLKDIWKICFADTNEYINSFFEKMYRPGRAVVAEAEGTLCAAMYVLEAGNLAFDKCGYLYALGTLPKYRGMGIGTAVTVGAAELGFELGCDICVTCPAEQGLFNYYKKLGFVNFSRISKQICSISGVHSGSSSRGIMLISVEEYIQLRDKLVPENAVRYNRTFMEFLNTSLLQSGGGFFALDTGECIAAVEANGDGGNSLIIKELLYSGEHTDRAARLFIRRLEAERASVAAPAEICTPAVCHTLAVYRDPRTVRNTGDAYFPFTLD